MTSRAGFAAIIGAPNAGKSTLTNRLVGAKVSIVTQKVQTTRFPVKGVAMAGDAQIILVDTPGIFKPKRRLDRAMVRAAQAQADDADAVVHLIDANAEIATAEGKGTASDRHCAEDSQAITAGMVGAGSKAILALNKIDLVKRDKLLALTQSLFETGAYSEVFMVSATNGSGVDDLKARLAELMPQSPWLTLRTRPPTCRPACSPPRSPARRSTCASTKNCPTPPPSRPPPSRNARTAACASTRPSMSNARASAASCSARAARCSNGSARPPARS